MDILFNQEKGEVSISFEPFMEEDSIFLMQLVHEEEWKRGTSVPDIGTPFFERLSAAKGKRKVTFSHDYLEFIVVFLGELLIQRLNEGIDTSALEMLLIQIEKWLFGEWHAEHCTIH
jgi:hypothetical protein